MELIPAIISKNFDDLEQKIKLIEPYVSAVQLDIMDGIFVDNKTWPYFDGQAVEDLGKLKCKVFLEAHLMIDRPQEVINLWLVMPKMKRLILHWEALEKIHGHEMTPYKTSATPGFPVVDLAEEVHKNNKELGVALNPDTPISVLDMFIEDVDLVLLMSVNPGFAGQEFIEKVIPKISALRQKYPDVKIEVDGGISAENVGAVAKAGADILVAGSAIFESGEIRIAVEKLKKSVLP